MITWFKKYLLKIAVFILETAVKELIEEYTPSSTLRKKQTLFLANVSKLINYANSLPGYEITGGELWRTPEQQAIYLSKGMSKTKFSKHQDRLAIDINVFIDGVYRTDKAAFAPLAKYWKELDSNNVSGFDWNWDYNHFQMS